MSSLPNVITPPTMPISIKWTWVPKAMDYELCKTRIGKQEFNLVSIITNISILFLIIYFNWSQLLGSELIFK